MSNIVARHLSFEKDPVQIGLEFETAFNGLALEALMVFISPAYDAEAVLNSLTNTFTCPVFGCTTAGEICSPQGYVQDSIAAVAFSSDHFSISPVLLAGLSRICEQPASLRDRIKEISTEGSSFALLLVDGLSGKEDRLTALLQHLIPGIPLIGGSAGDGLRFEQTLLFHEGQCLQDAALLLFFRTDLDCDVFCLEHFQPTPTKLVITKARPDQRIVDEINGLPAAEAYAAAVGVAPGQLNARFYASHPVMLKLGGEYFVRSILRKNEDNSLSFYCAIDEGLVLTLARPGDLIKHIRDDCQTIRQTFRRLDVIIGCDCILRRLELQDQDALPQVDALLEALPFIGFSTYGEQFGSVHINHTLTGVAIGEHR